MTLWLIVSLLVLSLITGGLVGRPWAVAAPVTIVALSYLGLHAGWWGNGVGDAWYIAMIIGMVLGIGAALVGVSTRRYIEKR